MVAINLADIEERSKIFTCSNPTRYQKHVNAAALELCVGDASLLLRRGKLFDEARRKVDSSGYDYVKKTSRSTRYGSSSNQHSKPKRKYIGAEIRASRILELNDSISSLKETMDLLGKQKEQYSNAEKYLQAAETNQTILEKGREKFKLEKELKVLKKAESKSKKSKRKCCRKSRSNVNKSPNSNESQLGNESQVSNASQASTEIISSSSSESERDSTESFTVPPLLREDAIYGAAALDAALAQKRADFESAQDFPKSPE